MKDKVLSFLKERNPDYVSGEDISRELGVSRTAVWKCITILKSKGYKIEASSKKGYRLGLLQDVLCAADISTGQNNQIGNEIIILDEVDSTNNYAKRIAFDSQKDGIVILAEKQTAGKGRLGRGWESSGGKGIWMSVILRPSISPTDLQIVTLASAVAVVEALKNKFNLDFGIKWPNDIILGGKKVCGILTEMVSEAERINYIVVGIGINVGQKQNEFTPELLDKAISLKSFCSGNNIEFPNVNRNDIVKELIYRLNHYYEQIEENAIDEIISEWKKYSVTLGKNVKFSMREVEYTGIAKDLGTDGRLIIECSDGVIRQIVSGEISVRGILGYIDI